MKIRYIGNFNDGTGWAKASTYNVLALDAAGYDVYCEERKYNNQNVVLENKIHELLAKERPVEYDIVVQHVLPSDYRYYQGVKNIGFVELETLTLSHTLWIKKLNSMDEIWVANYGSMQCLENSGIDKSKIKVFPHFFNIDKVKQTSDSVKIDQLDATFNFIFTGEFSKRKNLEALIFAFNNEFDISEPVNLVVKVNRDQETVSNFINDIKARMRKSNRYKNEIIISGYLEENVLNSIVSKCHSFVIPSYGEAWCYPAIESMGLGLIPIYTSGIGVQEYDVCGYEVDARVMPCYGATDTLPDLYTSNDYWIEINPFELQKKMRQLYNVYLEDRNAFNGMRNACIKQAELYDYKNSEMIRGIL